MPCKADISPPSIDTVLTSPEICPGLTEEPGDQLKLSSALGLDGERDNPRVQGVGVGGSMERKGKYIFEDSTKLFGVTDFLKTGA